MENRLPKPAEFSLRTVWLTTAVSTAGVALMALYLGALLRLSSDHWMAFWRAVGGAFLVLFTCTHLLNQRIFAPVLRYLADAAAGRAEPRGAAAEAAYARLTALPAITFVSGELWWAFGGVLVAVATRLQEPAFPATAMIACIAASTSGGLVGMIFHYFLSKRHYAPLRLHLARGLGDPEVRERLSAHVGLRTKMLVAVTGVTVVIVVFTLLLADAMGRRPAEGAAVAMREAFADELAEHHLSDALLARAEARALARAEEIASEQRAAQQLVSALVLAFGTLLAVGVAVVVARDVSETVAALGGELERVAAGDLRAAIGVEGEDEIGSLARAFERMTVAVRSTVATVAGAANEVENAAEGLARVAADVAVTTNEQVAGIRHAAGAMESIPRQIDGIASSAHGLSQSVDESSSSLSELGTAGEQLHSTASILNEKVDTVSGSIDRIIDSVRRVVESADDLSNAADETASGLAEMATTMTHVDENATESANLSRRVVDAAERGRERVQETIEGMAGIRSATESAQDVIRGLHQRVEAIGTIIGVIDDVADETNLLALNAAIIAAQAGDQGKAFSVVADEIKELADRVLENTQEIGALIRAVQEESQSAAQAMERGANRVESGVELAAEAGLALEEITTAARQSGDHIHGIVSAVKEQASASSHIVSLMERVRGRVDQIRKAGIQHERGNEVVRRSALAMREVAQQVTQTTREQARGTAAIARTVERVKDAVADIHLALQHQGRGSADAAASLEEVHARTRVHDGSAKSLADATEGLLRNAHGLRASIRRFTI
jgi:methyl-accepting chemotaxis protein